MYPSTKDKLFFPFVIHAFYTVDTCPNVWYLVVLYYGGNKEYTCACMYIIIIKIIYIYIYRAP